MLNDGFLFFTRQAENIKTNTGAYANGACGSGSYSETLNCKGYLVLATPTIPSLVIAGVQVLALAAVLAERLSVKVTWVSLLMTAHVKHGDAH